MTVPEIFDTPEFRRLFILSEIGKFTAKEMKEYMESWIETSDYYNIIDTAAEEAEKRGLARGREEGEAKGREETARNLKALGVDIDTIVKATGLTPDQVVEL